MHPDGQKGHKPSATAENPGTVRPLDLLRVHYKKSRHVFWDRPGYRVYLSKQGPVLVLLLCGGDKGDQSRDIDRAVGY